MTEDLTAEERAAIAAAVEQHGLARVAAALGVTRETLARTLARLSTRRGSRALMLANLPSLGRLEHAGGRVGGSETP